jgi:hypothetical protein
MIFKRNAVTALIHVPFSPLIPAGDGGQPGAGLQLYNGVFYGTTISGGDSLCTGQAPIGCGTIFKLYQGGSSWVEAVLHDFGPGVSNDPPVPSGLTADANGYLYGTLQSGGSNCSPSTLPNGCGSLYELGIRTPWLAAAQPSKAAVHLKLRIPWLVVLVLVTSTVTWYTSVSERAVR